MWEAIPLLTDYENYMKWIIALYVVGAALTLWLLVALLGILITPFL